MAHKLGILRFQKSEKLTSTDAARNSIVCCIYLLFLAAPWMILISSRLFVGTNFWQHVHDPYFVS